MPDAFLLFWTIGLDDRMKKWNIGKVYSKSSINIQGLRQQYKNNERISIYYTFKNSCPKWYTYKTLYLPEISCKETGKFFLVTIENKMLLQTIRILLNIFFNIFIPLSE